MGRKGIRLSGAKNSAFHEELARCEGCGCDIVDCEKCCQRSFPDGRYWGDSMPADLACGLAWSKARLLRGRASMQILR